MNRRWTFVFPALVIALALLVAVVAVSYWKPDQPIRTSESTEEVWSDATITRLTDEFEVTVTATFAPPRELQVRAGGTVGRVAIESGDIVEDGALMLVIDGRPVVAIESAVPLWRALSGGARGDDVAALQRFLVRRQLFDEAEVDGVYGTETRQAWDDYLAAIGVDRRDLFAPSEQSFIWLPTAHFEVGSVEVAAGSLVADGAVAVIEQPRLIALNIVEPDDVPLPAGAAWELELEGTTIAFDRSSTTVSPPPGHEFDLEPDVDYRGLVRRSRALEVRAIPATAVISGESASCVVTRTDRGRTVTPVRVHAGSLGVAFVSGLDTDEVLANPATSASITECSH